jgi:3-deoxy-7-phosphoheptulonate synthase
MTGEPAAKVRKTEVPSSPKLSAIDLPKLSHFVEHADVAHEIDNLRISNIRAMVYPQLLLEEFPASDMCQQTVRNSRVEVAKVLHGEDDRLLVVVGPCSIHDPAAAREYALRLKNEIETYRKDLVIVMRVYFEKPRTTVGWKGLINDPDMDNTFNVNKGLRMGRELLEKINSSGVPCGCEFLDTITPQYVADLVSWGAIGARTTECQLHRELASGLSMPVGFKNGTSGDCDIAIDGVIAGQHPHTFYSTTKHGTVAIVHSKGNDDCHMILRGGKDGPNYSASHVTKYAAQSEKKGITIGLVVDCSHGNSNKDFKNQPKVVKEICSQLIEGSKIRGVMLESHLLEGGQKLPDPAKMPAGQDVLGTLRYGVSVTDGCIGWTTTAEVLKELAAAVQARRAKVKAAA